MVVKSKIQTPKAPAQQKVTEEYHNACDGSIEWFQFDSDDEVEVWADDLSWMLLSFKVLDKHSQVPTRLAVQRAKNWKQEVLGFKQKHSTEKVPVELRFRLLQVHDWLKDNSPKEE